MEDLYNNLDIFYQINFYSDIKEPTLRQTKKNPYFLIESKKRKITYNTIQDLLLDDGVDIGQISEIRYLTEEEKNNNGKPKPLSEINFYEVKYLDKLYLHLILEEETETPEEQVILDEMEEYNIKIEKKEKEFESIYNSLKKQEMYNDKILSDNRFKNIEKNNFFIINNEDFKGSQTVIGSRNFSKEFSEIPEISEEDFSTEDIKHVKPSIHISQKNLDLALSNKINSFEEEKKHSSKTLLLKMKTQNISVKTRKDRIHLCYLYSNPLLGKDNIKKDFVDNDCFNEIINIYKIFHSSNILSNLKFEPVIEDFNTYFQSAPDILHINISSFSDKKLYINLDYKGELRYYPLEDLKRAIEIEQEVYKIKLLILSTQNIKKMFPFFNNKGFQSIIYIENAINYPQPNEIVENFIKELYENLLIQKKSVQDAFKISKNKVKGNITVDIFPSLKNSKKNVYIIEPSSGNQLNNNLNIEGEDIIKKFYSQKYLNLKEKKNNIKLNKNCPLNLDFITNNYRRIIGRNNELNNCINNMDRYDYVCVCAFPGAGKKSFIQLVGKFALERKMYQKVKYLELYYIRNADDIISNAKKEISEKMNLEEDDQLDYNDKKILLIINLNYIITKENDAPIFEELIYKFKDKYFNYLFAFTLSWKISLRSIKKKLRTPIIELNKLDEQKRKNLLYSISYNLKIKNIIGKKDDEIVKKNTFGYPNEIYLKTMYINLFSKEFNNINFDELTKEVIFKKLLEKNEDKMIKILSIFSILKLGMRQDIMLIFFEREEISFIEKNLNYLIFQENDSHGKNYLIDNSFKSIIKQILFEKYFKDFIKYLNLLLKLYAIIFRYLVGSVNYPYNICFEFHAGINKGFWFSVNSEDLIEKFCKEFQNFKAKKPEIYFDETQYFINTLYIFADDELVEFIKKNKDIDNFSEYISQISICLPTLLLFQNKISYTSRICELFKERLGYLNLVNSRLRLRLFIYWYSDDSNLIPNFSEENKLKDINFKAEINLIRIYDYTKKKDKLNFDISGIYRESLDYCTNSNFNMSKLNLLYGSMLKNKECISYYNIGKKYAEKDKNLYMEVLSLILKAEYYLEENEFAHVNDLIAECDNIIKENEKSFLNSDIKNKIENIIKDNNNKYKKFNKNKLFFFDSNPFFDENGNPLKTESNNSFYLKFNLTTKLPKYWQIELKNINENFMTDLEACLLNPVRFLYIGNDQYNEEGDLFYTKDFKSYPFDKKILKKKFTQAKNKCEIVILGFLNSEKISEYLLMNKFPHVVFIRKINELNKIFKKYPYYYFYFQRCFYYFITEFLLNLTKKNSMSINDAYRRANLAFETKFKKISDFLEDEESKEKIKEISKKIIILKGDEKKDDDVFYDCSEDYHNQNFNSSSGSLLSLENQDSLKSFDSLYNSSKKLNQGIIENNIQEDDENKEINKAKDKSFIKFFQFPKEGLNDEIFEKIYTSRIYGRKAILKNIINKLLNNRFINIFGDLDCGKTLIVWELCKYFYMNGHFQDGIFYISSNKPTKIENMNGIKELKKNNSKPANGNKKNEINDVLLIFDDYDCIKKKYFPFINKLNSYIIILTKKKAKDFFADLNEFNHKKKISMLSNEDFFINLDKNIDNKFAEEFIKYMAVIHNFPDKKMDINSFMDANQKYFIKNIVQKIKSIEKKNTKKKNINISSSQIIYKIDK